MRAVPEAAPPATVRPCRHGELGDIAAVEARSFGDPWPPEALAAEASHPASLILVATDGGGEVIGYASFRLAADESELLRLAVAPEHRRRGVATELVEEGLERLRRTGASACHLEVRVDNRPAVELYRGLGFAPSGRRRRYYADGTDALLLTAALSRRPASRRPMGRRDGSLHRAHRDR